MKMRSLALWKMREAAHPMVNVVMLHAAATAVLVTRNRNHVQVSDLLFRAYVQLYWPPSELLSCLFSFTFRNISGF